MSAATGRGERIGTPNSRCRGRAVAVSLEEGPSILALATLRVQYIFKGVDAGPPDPAYKSRGRQRPMGESQPILGDMAQLEPLSLPREQHGMVPDPGPAPHRMHADLPGVPWPGPTLATKSQCPGRRKPA